MSAPMVRNFFEPLKDEIKEIIAPPQKALIVVPDAEDAVEGDAMPPAEDDDVLRALPLDDSAFDNVQRAIPIDEGDLEEGFEEVE